jgi:hypothetical protein
MSRRLTAAVVMLLALLAAATWVASGTGATEIKSGCSLLTTAEVTAAIGEPVAKVKGGRSATGAVFCNWYGNDDHLFQKGISLIAASDNVQTRYKGYVSLLSPTKAMPGVGLAAVSSGTEIVARNARAVVQISELSRGTLTLPAIKPLVVKALARA